MASDRLHKLRNTVTYQLAEKKYKDKAWCVLGEDMLLIQIVKQRLYFDIEKLSADDMRDLAHLLTIVLDHTFEI